jgi:transcriptional regulator with AAA-type ATPase domain
LLSIAGIFIISNIPIISMITESDERVQSLVSKISRYYNVLTEVSKLEKDTFLDQVSVLRQQGISIHTIARQLDVHPSRVQRALAKLYKLNPGSAIQNVFASNQDSTFVGRAGEMDILRDTLHAVVGGSGKLVLLSGEPGIGKTRLAEELSSYATLTSFLALDTNNTSICPPTQGIAIAL